MSVARELEWGPGDTLLRFRAEHAPDRGADARALLGPVARDGAELAALARARAPDPERRRRALAALRPEWARLDLPPAARAAAERLEDPATRIVIAGQQPALWGGPLLLAVKALAAIRAAEELSRAGVPAVALFWIASEDHDAKELHGGVVVPRRGGPPVPLGSPFEPGRRMLGRLRHPVDGATRLAAIEPLLAGTPHGAALRERLARTLRENPADEFQALWVELFGGRGLLPVRPEWLRGLARPVIAAELARPGALEREVRTAIARLGALDLPVPIPEPAELPFFLIDDAGDRHRLLLDGDRARVGGPGGELRPLAEIARDLERAPERASPDALLRPLVQDAILEPVATVLGPTELAYHAELAESYAPRGIPRPILLPRPRVRVLDGEDARALERLGVDPGTLYPGEPASARLFSPEARRRRLELARLAEPLVGMIEAWSVEDGLEPALRKRTDRLGRRLREDFAKLADALERGAARDVEDERRALERILGRIFPLGEEGERSAALLGFLAEHGEAGLAAIHDAVPPGCGRLRLVVLAPEREGVRDAP